MIHAKHICVDELVVMIFIIIFVACITICRKHTIIWFLVATQPPRNKDSLRVSSIKNVAHEIIKRESWLIVCGYSILDLKKCFNLSKVVKFMRASYYTLAILFSYLYTFYGLFILFCTIWRHDEISCSNGAQKKMMYLRPRIRHVNFIVLSYPNKRKARKKETSWLLGSVRSVRNHQSQFYIEVPLQSRFVSTNELRAYRMRLWRSH